MSKLILPVLLLMQLCSFAQKQAVSKPRFQSFLQLGLLEGQKGSAFQMHTVNGFRWKGWSAGVGVGLDYYGVRSVPLFLDVRKSIFNKEQSPFIYVSGGLSFPWLKETEETWLQVRGKRGVMYEAGLGYQLPLRKHALFFSAGYSVKTHNEEITEPTFCIWGPCPDRISSSTYTFRRLSIRAGFRF
jgi:hypothetical protein